MPVLLLTLLSGCWNTHQEDGQQPTLSLDSRLLTGSVTRPTSANRILTGDAKFKKPQHWWENESECRFESDTKKTAWSALVNGFSNLSQFKSDAKDYIPDAVADLRDPHRCIRGANAWLLGEIGECSQQARSGLKSLIGRETDQQVKSEASSALKKIPLDHCPK